MNKFEIKTKENNLIISYFSGFIPKNNIKVERELFAKMCKEGCKNYNKKYSCPPFTPCFEKIAQKYNGLFIVMFLCNLDNIKSTEYNKIRIANVVMKSRIIKLMRYLENKYNRIFLSTGSCNLCKPCKLKLNLPCAHPNKRRYSLESFGVNCDDISKKLFSRPILWYKDKKAPKYTCVLCGLICNANEEEIIKGEMDKWIKANLAPKLE